MEDRSRILIVDDDNVLKRSLVDWFENVTDYIVTGVDCGEDAVKLLAENSFDVVITDLRMPGIDGMEVLRQSKRLDPTAEVILMTGYGAENTAEDSMKEGAFIYITKPFSAEMLELIVRKIVDHQALSRENIALRQKLRDSAVV